MWGKYFLVLAAVSVSPAYALDPFGLKVRPNFALVNGGSLPNKLSAVRGLFKNLNHLDLSTRKIRLEPEPGLLPYGVQTGHWIDGASSERWMGIPQSSTVSQKIGFKADQVWDLPVGSALVLHISFPWTTPANHAVVHRRVETRVIFRDVSDWKTYNYRWVKNTSTGNFDDAVLVTKTTSPVLIDLGGGKRRTWVHMDNNECLDCHIKTRGFAIGVRTEQLNGDFSYPQTGTTDNQIRALNNIKMFSKTILGGSNAHAYIKNFPWYADPYAAANRSGSHNRKARSYLAANCVSCHFGKYSPSGLDMDFRFKAVPDTVKCGNNNEPPCMNVVNKIPTKGSWGLFLPYLIALDSNGKKGYPARTMVSHRMSWRGSGQMPPLDTHAVDTQGLALIRNWVQAGLNPASTEIIGKGCGNYPSTEPILSATPPKLGARFRISGKTLPTKRTGVLVASFDSEYEARNVFGRGCRLRANLSQGLVLANIQAQPDGNWFLDISLPDSVSLAGSQVVLQAAFFSAAPNSISLTNGARLTFGY